MFDTMTLTKIVGGFGGALLIFLLGNWAADSLYGLGEGEGEAEGEHVAGYVIETGEGEEEETAEAEISFETLLASADAGKGEKLFAKCKACHKVESGANATGPTLFGIVGRNVSSVEGFRYSGKLGETSEVWTPERLNAFLESPKGFAPGTSMSFSGLKKIEDRANLIAYLETIGG